MDIIQQRNMEAREAILKNAVLCNVTLYPMTDIETDAIFPVRNVGIITHFTLQGDYEGVERVNVYDFNFNTRIDAKLPALPCHYDKVLLQLASVFFNPWHPDDWMIPDLRGAIYANVVNATMQVRLYGRRCNKVCVTQYYFDSLPMLPGHGGSIPRLPMLDLAAVRCIR